LKEEEKRRPSAKEEEEEKSCAEIGRGAAVPPGASV
tara:strand:- start:358 stop:465 length:108 start_codon:yes stop_codon:yes gene_type:complete